MSNVTYRHRKTNREMVVGNWERVRRQILERSGWFLVEPEVQNKIEKIVNTPIQGKEPLIESEKEMDDFTTLKGVTAELMETLQAEGFLTFGDLAKATDEQLLSVSGIGPKKLATIREQLR